MGAAWCGEAAEADAALAHSSQAARYLLVGKDDCVRKATKARARPGARRRELGAGVGRRLHSLAPVPRYAVSLVVFSGKSGHQHTALCASCTTPFCITGAEAPGPSGMLHVVGSPPAVPGTCRHARRRSRRPLRGRAGARRASTSRRTCGACAPR
jgi:hypothetical protein